MSSYSDTSIRSAKRKTPANSRSTFCWHCGEAVPSTLRTQKATCPSCGEEISFEDVIVLEQRVQRVRTLGELRILREAFLVAGDSYCGQLRLMGGGFAGKIISQGAAKLENCQGQFRGELHCESFSLSKNSQVEFLHPLRCHSALIDGHFKGDLLCSGVVKLGNEAQLEGTCRAQSISTGVNSVLAASVSLRGKPKSFLLLAKSLSTSTLSEQELRNSEATQDPDPENANTESPTAKTRSYQQKLAAIYYQTSLLRPV